MRVRVIRRFHVSILFVPKKSKIAKFNVKKKNHVNELILKFEFVLQDLWFVFQKIWEYFRLDCAIGRIFPTTIRFSIVRVTKSKEKNRTSNVEIRYF